MEKYSQEWWNKENEKLKNKIQRERKRKQDIDIMYNSDIRFELLREIGIALKELVVNLLKRKRN